MLKFMSLLLSLIFVFSSSVIFPGGGDANCELTIAVTADPHYTVPAERIGGNIDDPIFWYANRRAALENEIGFIIDEFLRQCAGNECEYILIAGDLSGNGRTNPEQHHGIAEKLAAFEEATGKQVFVINGNHDVAYNGETDVDDFKTIYAPFGYDEAITVDPDSCSYAADLNDTYRLLALDSCDHSVSSADGLTDARKSWLRTQALQARKEGKSVILMMHHNLLDHIPAQRIFSRDFIVRNHLSTAESFANLGIHAVFTGHEHCSDVAVYTSTLGNRIYDFSTTALIMYPLQYRMVTFSKNRIEYEARTIDSIDTDALTAQVAGYTPAQIALMNEGLNDYALGFLKAGIRHRLADSLSMEKIGIAEGEPYYNLVKTATDGLNDILAMPLYGEGSAAELAAKYGIEIPASPYKNGWELAMTLVAAHFAGNEDKTLESTEVTILLRMIALILRYDLAGVADEVFLNAANELLTNNGDDGIAGRLTMFASNTYGPITPGEYFMLALIAPLLHGFAYDGDGVDDNNGVLTGFAPETPEEAAANRDEALKALTEKILFSLELMKKYFVKGLF
ncbi:MAG: metallophosphoesterase family protein [Acutalibacteraceae bacterium]|jgi:hypothetical protein